MSRIVRHNESVSGIPTSYDENYSIYSGGSYNQGETNSNSTNYSTIWLTHGSRAVTSFYYNFSLNIPTNVTISSVTAYVKVYINQTNSNRVATRQVQLYAGETAKGSPTTVANTASRTSMTAGTWTASELNNAKIRIYAVRGTNGTTTNYYFRFYGADITVDYYWDETFYAITTSSSVQGVGISAQSGETTSGGTNVITITGVGSLAEIKLMDNDVDVTSSLVRSGSNYTYTLSNVNADHTLTVENGLPSYSINVSSTYAGATITANPVSVQEGSSCLLTLTTSDISKVSVVDNGSDITSQFTGSNGTFTYTLTNVITAHTIVVSEVTKKLYMKIDGVMKSVSRIHMKTNNVWTTISFVDFWRKVNGVYVNGEAVSGTTFLMYGGEMESIPEIGTVNKTSSDLTITINDNALESGTYKMFYEDSTRTPLERVDEITEFTIS